MTEHESSVDQWPKGGMKFLTETTKDCNCNQYNTEKH